MSVIRQLYGRPLSLLADLYQFTMAYAHWRAADPEREAVFHLFLRNAPFDGGPAVACGLDAVLEFLADLRFSEDDLDYLGRQRDPRGQRLLADEFLDYLRDMRFTGDVHAVPEGTAVFPHEPLLRVRAPVLQAQLLEAALLNLVNFPTLVASKAARIAFAAKGDPVLDFGLRKAHGPGAGALAARAAYVGGCAGTANVLAGRLFGIPIKGTHAHSWVMAFDDEIEAFERYAQALPDNCIFLVDTYDTEAGIEHAIEVGRRLRERGHEMVGIRLDSGDLGGLAHRARKMLDRAGFDNAAIAASSSVDEHVIAELKAGGAPIVLWGVGTRLTTGQPDAALDGVYKLTAIRDERGEWQHRLKLSNTPEKQTNPGMQQVRRFYDGDRPLGDWIYDEIAGADFKCAYDRESGGRSPPPSGSRHQDLLVPVVEGGRTVYELPQLDAVRERAMAEFARFADIGGYTVALEERLYRERERLVHRHKAS